jgi:hypothetical protein
MDALVSSVNRAEECCPQVCDFENRVEGIGINPNYFPGNMEEVSIYNRSPFSASDKYINCMLLTYQKFKSTQWYL